MPLPNMTAAPGTREVNDELSKLNKSKRYPLTKYQERQIAEAGKIYIYNVSPIHEWPKFQGQLGTLTIKKRPEGQLVSEPLVVPGAVARWYDKGLGRKEVFIEDGREIAEDICGCSKEYPAESANNNLTNFGVFIVNRPFEQLSEDEQESVLDAANEKLVQKLREILLEADNYFSAEATKKFVGKIHNAALDAFNHLTDSNETRPWALVRASRIAKTECPFCGAANKPGVVKCQTCLEVIDPEAYAALKKQQEGRTPHKKA